jgi:putative ABC transport system permease protein
MGLRRLIIRNLAFYWRTNIAIVLGVGTAVAVLSGALLVGQSVQGSLRRLLFERIGATEAIVAADRFFSEKLADSLAPGDGSSCPIIQLKGVVVHEQSKVRIHDVNVYGIDERFWKFHSQPGENLSEDHSALVGDTLAQQLGAIPGDTLLLRIETGQGVPREWLYGRREDLGKTLRLTCRAILPGSRLGEFALRPNQGNVYSIFLPLKRLQKDLEQASQVNTVLIAGKNPPAEISFLHNALKKNITLQDLGLRMRPLPSGDGFSLESNRIILDDSIARSGIQSAQEAGAKVSPIYAYLANSIRWKNREIPYSVITAADISQNALETIHSDGSKSVAAESGNAIWLTGWARRDLGISTGEPVEIDYYVWLEEGKLATRTARFIFAGVASLAGDIDTTLAPEIPGVTEAHSMSAWDPPFPLDLSRIRREDEEYWNKYRATPKAFISLAKGQELWKNRFGKLTAVRITSPAGTNDGSIRERFLKSFSGRLDPKQAGFSVVSLKEQGLSAARGSTDFGQYFIYFSFFLIAAALLLSSLFFKLMIEQRVREIGTLRAAGFSLRNLRRIFLCEGLVISLLGSLIGLMGSVLYGWFMVYGLRTWWIDAVGTRRIGLYVSWTSLAVGAAAGIIVSFGTIVWTLRDLGRNSPRFAIAGALESAAIQKRRARWLALVSSFAFLAALSLIAAAVSGKVSQLEGFLGAGFLLLVAALCAIARQLRKSNPSQVRGTGFPAYLRLGFRNAMHRPGRSLVCIALIASATFIIVAMEAFRQNSTSGLPGPRSGTGGFSLMAESSLPIINDLNSQDGREALGLFEDIPYLRQTIFASFRERIGDDASCLNLYKPQDPTILGAPHSFVSLNRFSFAETMASSPEQKINPWLLLESDMKNGAIPAIADANTIQYILHLSVNRDLTVRGSNGNPLHLHLVASLKDSILQGKILISESNFLKFFPDQEGRRFFLLDTPVEHAASLIKALRERLADWGFNVELSGQRLSEYHRVENAYLSTFQSLGALGLILGTIGLAAVLLRNALERRGEIALLRAVGYRKKVLTGIILAENSLLIVCGLATGTVCALFAVTPALVARSSSFPAVMIGRVLLIVLFVGFIASLLAVIAAFRSSLLAALHSE